MIKKFRGAIILLLITTGIASADDEIKIGWIGPLTGNASALGVDSVEVARNIFSEINATGGINGHRIKFIVEDDQYQSAKTVSAYNKLVYQDEARIIFVLTYGGVFAVAQKAKTDNVILLDPLDCDDELAALPSNVFCVAKRTEDLGIQNALHAIKYKNNPAAIIYFDGDPFPVKVAQSTRDTLEKGGVEVVTYEGISSSSGDFRSILSKIKTKGAKSLFVYGYDDFGLAFKQARQMGINIPFYSVPGAGIGTSGFNAGAGDAVNGTFVGGWFAPRTDAYQEFLGDYKKRMGREPLLEVSTIPTYDISQILKNELGKATNEQGNVDTKLLQDQFYKVKNYQGLSGTITIEPDGAVRTLKVGMYSYNKGDFKPEN